MTESEKVKKWFDSELSMRPEESLDSVECEEVKEICLNAIEEKEQYRAIGTVSDLQEKMKFLEFLYNHIQPNEMEQYLAMYHASGEKGDYSHE